MAEEPKTDATPPAAAPKRGPVVITMAVLASLTVGAAGGIFFMLKKIPKAPPVATAGPAGEHGAEATAPPPEEPEEKAEGGEHGEGGAAAEKVITMQPFIVNLEEESGEARFLKVTIAVELVSTKWNKHFEKETPKIRSSVLLLLSNLKLANTQGSANKKKILEQVHAAVADVIGKNSVRDIYLTEFVIQ